MTGGICKTAAGWPKAPFASRAPQGSSGGQSCPHPGQCLNEIQPERRKVALDSACPADHDMIRSSRAIGANHCASQLAKSPLHPIAYNGIADLLRHGDPQPLCRIAIIALAHQQHKAGRRHPACCIGGQKIRPLSNRNQAESFLRPRARRARITARPPAVAIRARKP